MLRAAPASPYLTSKGLRAPAALQSLKGDRAFKRVRKGRAGHSKLLSLRWIPNPDGISKVGIVVSKKVGKAVVRNRVRRRLREALRTTHLAGAKQKGVDLVVIARPEAATASFGDLSQALYQALKQSKLV